MRLISFFKKYLEINENQWFFFDIFSFIFCIVEIDYVGISVFKGGVWGIFFKFTLKAFRSIQMTLGIIQNDYFDYVKHVWDIFGTIRSLKIIFWDYIFENFRLKMNKNTLFGILWLYKGNYYLFKLRNEEFRYLRSEYMTIIISWLFKIWTQMTLKVASFQRSLEPKLVEIWKN